MRDLRVEARAVGIGAVKYADLSGDREKDYICRAGGHAGGGGTTGVRMPVLTAATEAARVVRAAG